MAPVRVIAALAAVAVLGGCGGSSGTSTTRGESTAAQQPAVTTCAGGLKTNQTCYFAEQAATMHATHLEAFTVAGEPMHCIGTKKEWICRSTRTTAWVQQT
jgi:hypothetical protein